jgi:hypothetical protein
MMKIIFAAQWTLWHDKLERMALTNRHNNASLILEVLDVLPSYPSLNGKESTVNRALGGSTYPG